MRSDLYWFREYGTALDGNANLLVERQPTSLPYSSPNGHREGQKRIRTASAFCVEVAVTVTVTVK